MVGGEAVVASSETVDSVGETAALGEIVEKTAVNEWQKQRMRTRAGRKSSACYACFAVVRERLGGRLVDPH